MVPLVTPTAFWQTAIEDQDPAAVGEELGIGRGAVYAAKARVIKALRENKRADFLVALDQFVAAKELDTLKNDIPYANWFSGIGATLLQLTAFLRPDLAAAVVDAGATVDLHSACGIGDVDAMGAAAIDLLRDDARWRTMSESARQRALEEFPEEKIVARYRSIYELALRG